MTINNQNIEVAYAWDGTAKDFTITFEAIDPLQIKWMYRDGRSDDLNANVIVSDTDPWVLRLEPGSAGDILIYRDTPITQETEYRAYDAFPAEAHEAALDKLTSICQEIEGDKINVIDGDMRYLRLSGGSMSGNINMSGKHVKWLHDPIQDQDAVNKRWYQANQIPGIQGDIGPIGPPPAVTADANAVPWEEGADVTVTPDSDPYTGVHMDFQIPAGPVGVTPDFSADVETLEPEEDATVTVTQTGPPDAHAVNLLFAIPQGEKGDKGEGIDFKGEVPTAGDLPDSGNVDGEAWWVADENSLYVWGGETEEWENLGDIRGPEGEAGKGWKSGTYNSGNYTVTFTGQDNSPELTFTTGSLQGGKGDAGQDAYNPVVGSVTTETKPDGTDAEVSVEANGDGNFDFDFKIPRGHSPSVNNVTTLTGAAGSDAYVIVASTPDYDLDFGFTIPKGDSGSQGVPGISHYDYGTVEGAVISGFSTFSTAPTLEIRSALKMLTVPETKKLGTLQLSMLASEMASPFWDITLNEFDLGHTLVVIVDASAGFEVGINFVIPGSDILAPKGEVPNVKEGEVVLFALTRVAMGVFLNVTPAFEVVV